MKRYFTLITFVALLFCMTQIVYAQRCTYGACEVVVSWEVPSPICFGTSILPEPQPTPECGYTLETYNCDGPKCIAGNAQVVLNPCLIWPSCSPVIAANFCSNQEESFYVTIKYQKANLYTPWVCESNNCFFGDCSVFYPECDRGQARCPSF